MTCIEIKSGYGLTLDAEARMLRAARWLGAHLPVTVSTSFLGAHALPPEFAGRADEYIDVVAQEWLPALARDGLVDTVDAWCEDIAFTAAQCERVFAAAAGLGLRVRLHAEQLSNVGGSPMAARHRALSCDHLEYTTEDDAAALAAAGTVAVLLPIAFYALAETRRPPIDAFRRLGVPMAVATDCNPGSAPGASLLLAMNMARRLFGLTSEEVLLGVTRHAARALAMDGERGALTPGRAADFAVWSIDGRSTSSVTGLDSTPAAWSCARARSCSSGRFSGCRMRAIRRRRCLITPTTDHLPYLLRSNRLRYAWSPLSPCRSAAPFTGCSRAPAPCCRRWSERRDQVGDCGRIAVQDIRCATRSGTPVRAAAEEVRIRADAEHLSQALGRRKYGALSKMPSNVGVLNPGWWPRKRACDSAHHPLRSLAGTDESKCREPTVCSTRGTDRYPHFAP